MTFPVKDWKQSPDPSTPLNAAAVKDMEQRVSDYMDTMVANAQAGAYTLVLSDRGKVIEVSSATGVALTVPPNSSVAFPIGALIEVWQGGAGVVTITAGGGVTLRSRGGLVATAGQYASVALRKRATDEWVIAGDLA